MCFPKTWTVSSATTRTKTRNSTRGILQLRVQLTTQTKLEASKQKQRFATRVQRSSTGILNQSLKWRPIPYSGFWTRSARERFQVRGRSPSCFFRKNTEESFRRNVPSHKRATKLTERCHATCIQRLNTETNNQSLHWDLSGALVFDSKLPTDFSGFQSFSRENNEVYRTMPRDCIQGLNTETINQSLQWDPSGALVFDSKSPTDFPGFLVNLNLTSFGRVIG